MAGEFVQGAENSSALEVRNQAHFLFPGCLMPNMPDLVLQTTADLLSPKQSHRNWSGKCCGGAEQTPPLFAELLARSPTLLNGPSFRNVHSISLKSCGSQYFCLYTFIFFFPQNIAIIIKMGYSFLLLSQQCNFLKLIKN